MLNLNKKNDYKDSYCIQEITANEIGPTVLEADI